MRISSFWSAETQVGLQVQYSVSVFDFGRNWNVSIGCSKNSVRYHENLSSRSHVVKFVQTDGRTDTEILRGAPQRCERARKRRDVVPHYFVLKRKGRDVTVFYTYNRGADICVYTRTQCLKNCSQATSQWWSLIVLCTARTVCGRLTCSLDTEKRWKKIGESARFLCWRVRFGMLYVETLAINVPIL
jgi:hypothetical protein